MIALLLVLAAAPFNRTTIHRVVNKHAGDLQECADKEAFPPDGMMEMTFVVNIEGHATDITGEHHPLRRTVSVRRAETSSVEFSVTGKEERDP
jgi:hypothetical protein